MYTKETKTPILYDISIFKSSSSLFTICCVIICQFKIVKPRYVAKPNSPNGPISKSAMTMPKHIDRISQIIVICILRMELHTEPMGM